MALTSSSNISLGKIAENFNLLEPLTGKKRNLQDLKGIQATLIMFICNHCPFVKHIQEGIVQFANDYSEKKTGIIAINSNDVIQYPEDSPENMIKLSQKLHFSFPYLFDETQKVAKAYQAACTPDFFLFDAHLKLAYHGQFDDSRPGNSEPVTGSDLRKAIDYLLEEQKVLSVQKPSIGCNIKWK